MRTLFISAVVLLCACGQSAPDAAKQTAAASSTPAAAVASAAEPIWFFCDGIDAPVVYLFADGPSDGATRFIEYDKRTGATVRSFDLQVGEGDGAAGSVYIPLKKDGADFGTVRQVNPGNFETPGAAYTVPFTSVVIEGRNVSCRWLPRTRVAAFTGRRSFVISEDADGDLLYSTYDFAHASTMPVDLSDNGRSTQVSVEVRGGQENVRADGADFNFTGRDGYSYHIALNSLNGTGTLQVLRNGTQVQSEPLTAFLVGQAEAD